MTDETRAAAAASDLDRRTQDLIQMALERRADQERREAAAAARVPRTAAGLTFRVLSKIQPLPGQLHAAMNIAHGELRRCHNALTRSPADPRAAVNLAAAEAQLERVRRRSRIPS